MLYAKEKGEEQLLQAAQNGMGGAERAASEESTGDQLLRKTEEWGRAVAVGSGNMLRQSAHKLKVGRAHRLGEQQEHAFSGQGGPPARQLKEKSPGRPRTQQGAAHGPRVGKPTVKAERQPVKTPREIHTAIQQTAHTAKQAAQRGPSRLQELRRKTRTAGWALVNTAKACIAAVKSHVATLAAGVGFASRIVLLICLIALVAARRSAFSFRPSRPEKG